MNDDLLTLIAKTESATHLFDEKRTFVINDTIGIALLFAANFSKKPSKSTIICQNLYHAQKVYDLLCLLIGNENVLLFPADDLLRGDLLTSSKELLAQRLYVLNQLLQNKNCILVTHVTAVIAPLPRPNIFSKNTLSFNVNNQYKMESIIDDLSLMGYTRVNKIDQTLQYARRGDILDIYPTNYDNPLRLEFFGDELEEIKFFDIPTQSSFGHMDSVDVPPAIDYLFSTEEIKNFKQNILSQSEIDILEIGKDKSDIYLTNLQKDIDHVLTHTYNPRIYKYVKYISSNTGSVLDYMKPDFVFITNKDEFNNSLSFATQEARLYFRESFENGKLPSHLEMYNDIENVLKPYKVGFSKPFRTNSNDIEFNIQPLVFNRSTINTLEMVINSYLPLAKKIIFCVSNKQQYEIICKYLKENKIDYDKLKNLAIPEKNIGIALVSLDEGFELEEEKIFFLSSRELFGFQGNASRYLSRFKEGIILKNYDDLRSGDYVVHEQYGIGRFIKIETILVDGVHTDFLHIQYAGTNVLYVPLSQFRLIRKYSGREGAEPKLSKLNGKDWEKTKSKIKQRVNELADRLYQLYSARAVEKGFAFQKDDELQIQFENEFPYELTDDQKTSLKEIKCDMESEYVMDRLLCGDVGFGKTEVAFRAIFKAISSGKQAAILCPTTLLARQHFELASQRFANYGIKITIISRLVSEKEQRKYMKGLEDGSIHLAIGTHRLLNKDFVFKDLGLLVVDEEQKFGVEQKERIKEIKKNLDVLSLSATPIPRTLQMSLVGVRPVSQITTPPVNRSSIQTYVAPYNFNVVKELIERELSRKGQVFYIHNVVFSINQIAEKLHQEIPYANIGIVHGQMDKDEIENVMLRFYSGEINILVATSIIENGIDIPNANLIIVEDADCFGLAQLYQIKGRVGRGNRIAYAYLFYNEYKEINQTAQKRLKAIQDFAELGSGFKIAQRDLMIRGAGDILGPEQAGFIDSVGLDLYLKLLNEVLEEKRSGKKPEQPKPLILFDIDAYIPSNYAIDEDKIQLYQEIGNSKTIKEVQGIKKHIREVYGKLPDEVSLLIEKRKVDLLLECEEFNKIETITNSIEITLSSKFSDINGIGNKLFESLRPYLDKITVTYLQKILRIRLVKEGNWFLNLKTIIELIHEIYNKMNKEK